MPNVNAVHERTFDRVHDIQDAYRKLLEAMARPGRLFDLSGAASKQTGLSARDAMISVFALMLLDNEVGFAAVMEEGGKAEARINRLTFSRPRPVAQADYIFASGMENEERIRAVAAEWKRGSLIQPEDGATLFLQVEGFREEEASARWSLSGPGINGARELAVQGLSGVWLEERSKANAEYPLGVDLVLFAEDGMIAALPRTTIISGVNK